VLLYLGSTCRLKRSRAAGAMVKILGFLGVPFAIMEEEADSGFLAYQLGILFPPPIRPGGSSPP